MTYVLITLAVVVVVWFVIRGRWHLFSIAEDMLTCDRGDLSGKPVSPGDRKDGLWLLPVVLCLLGWERLVDVVAWFRARARRKE